MLPLVRPRFRLVPRMAIAKLCSLVVALAVLFGIGQARARYFYCEGLGLSATDPCAQPADHSSPCPLASFERTPVDCCRVITMPSMPDGARAAPPTVPAASVVAVLPPAQGAVDVAGNGSARVALGGERWRPPPRSANERRARLMVFLT